MLPSTDDFLYVIMVIFWFISFVNHSKHLLGIFFCVSMKMPEYLEVLLDFVLRFKSSKEFHGFSIPFNPFDDPNHCNNCLSKINP